MKPIGINVPIKSLRAIDYLVESDMYPTRSEFIRTAIKSLLKKINHATLMHTILKGDSLKQEQLSNFLKNVSHTDRVLLEQNLKPENEILDLVNTKFKISISKQRHIYL